MILTEKLIVSILESRVETSQLAFLLTSLQMRGPKACAKMVSNVNCFLLHFSFDGSQIT